MLTESELSILLRAGLAALLGLLIGRERKAAGAPIRARTIALAAMTSTLLTAVGMELFHEQNSRIVQGIVAGIGFLGAGVIIRSDMGEVRGLTTAASLWAMSAIGVAIGAGHEILGVLLTLLTYGFIAWDEWPLVSRLRQRRAQQQVEAAESQQPAETRSESDVSGA
ncbi:MAG: MgtC/SapB family protein [Chloroflexi bacterium]|nr:MgtC/SapB family protein [Chloroflexota bacterium]